MVRHEEGHFSHRIGLLRAMVLGANDGIISTACLILGVAAADGTRNAIITAGVAGLVAGAASMAIGEYVSVSSQRDAEQADIAKETWELEHTPEHELDELTAIYKGKGLTQELARAVAVQLTKEDALKVHMAEELGITHLTLARPVQASVSSAGSFSVGAAIPLIAVALAASSPAHRYNHCCCCIGACRAWNLECKSRWSTSIATDVPCGFWWFGGDGFHHGRWSACGFSSSLNANSSLIAR